MAIRPFPAGIMDWFTICVLQKICVSPSIGEAVTVQASPLREVKIAPSQEFARLAKYVKYMSC